MLEKFNLKNSPYNAPAASGSVLLSHKPSVAQSPSTLKNLNGASTLSVRPSYFFLQHTNSQSRKPALGPQGSQFRSLANTSGLETNSTVGSVANGGSLNKKHSLAAIGSVQKISNDMSQKLFGFTNSEAQLEPVAEGELNKDRSYLPTQNV
jgi:hypothetical protein